MAKKKTWLSKFEVVGILPGKIVFLGKILDLSNANLPMAKVQALYDSPSGKKYLKLIKTDSKKDK